MSPVVRRLIVLVVVVEAAVGGWLVSRRLLRLPPVVPASFPDDPLLGADVRELAARADRGGAAEWRSLGEALLGQGLYLHAEDAFARAVALDPRSIDALFGLAFCTDRTGRMAASNPLYRRCLEVPDPSADGLGRAPFARYAIARNLLRLGDLAGAEAAFRENDAFVPARFQLAKLLARDSRGDEAARIVDELLRQIPLALELHQLKARILEGSGGTAEAFRARAMEERSAHLVESNFGTDYVRPFTTRLGLPLVLHEVEGLMAPHGGGVPLDPAAVGEGLESIEAILDGTRLPQRVPVAAARATLALEAGDDEGLVRAVAVMDEAGDRGPARLAFDAVLCDRAGDAVGARTLRERAVSMAPSAALHRALAADYGRIGDEKSARLHRARQHFHEGKAAYRRNRLEDALREFREAASLDDGHVATWYHLGEMAYHLRKRQEAVDAFRRVVDLEADHERALRWLDLLANATGAAAVSAGP